ncbi:hypothetical protein [Sphingomonas sp. SAFR-052]|uniref:hypothetical protein n=1 Tax=Sphingomonas sp. SAFR-052 TaxID=3436867 RepID=UPI003F8188EF
MKEFKNETFSRLFDRGDRRRIEDMAFHECQFENCALSLTEDIAQMSEVRRVEMVDCAINGCHTGPMVASEVTISGLKTNDLLIFWSPFLDRVVLSGEIGKIKINANGGTSTVSRRQQQFFDEYRAKFYAGVEWALDISKASFKEFDIRGVPGKLIRRDPESQILITRERALEFATRGWEKQLDSSNKIWPFMVNLFLSDGDADTVFVAPLGAAKAKRDVMLNGLHELRRIGLAEPD